MPKFPLFIAAAMLSATLAPPAISYGTDPAPQTLQEIIQTAELGPKFAQAEGICALQITPILASILGLPGEPQSKDLTPVQTSSTCSGQ